MKNLNLNIPANKIIQLSDHTSPNKLHESQRLVSLYQLRLTSLVIIKQLMRLCKAVQKHRGLSMGILAGEAGFVPQFEVLQNQINHRISVLHAFCQSSQSPLSEGDANKVSELWTTVKVGWDDDSVLENFHFHCHFVEQILQVAMQLSQSFEAVVDSDEQNHNEQQPLAKTDLLDFVCCRLPYMIELLGMVRALSVHAATHGFSVDEHDKKLRYLCQCVQVEKIKVLSDVESLNGDLGNDIPSLLVLKTYQYKLDAFIERVSQSVISTDRISVSGSDLFIMATDIIDTYWRVVDDGIDRLHHIQEEMLEQWCLNES